MVIGHPDNVLKGLSYNLIKLNIKAEQKNRNKAVITEYKSQSISEVIHAYQAPLAIWP